MARKKSGRPVARPPLPLAFRSSLFARFARGQDGLGASNFSKNNKGISIIKQSCKWSYKAEYAGIGELELLAAAFRFGERVFPAMPLPPDQILPKPASIDHCTSINLIGHGDVKPVVIVESCRVKRKGRLD